MPDEDEIQEKQDAVDSMKDDDSVSTEDTQAAEIDLLNAKIESLDETKEDKPSDDIEFFKDPII